MTSVADFFANTPVGTYVYKPTPAGAYRRPTAAAPSQTGPGPGPSYTPPKTSALPTSQTPAPTAAFQPTGWNATAQVTKPAPDGGTYVQNQYGAWTYFSAQQVANRASGPPSPATVASEPYAVGEVPTASALGFAPGTRSNSIDIPGTGTIYQTATGQSAFVPYGGAGPAAQGPPGVVSYASQQALQSVQDRLQALELAGGRFLHMGMDGYGDEAGANSPPSSSGGLFGLPTPVVIVGGIVALLFLPKLLRR